MFDVDRVGWDDCALVVGVGLSLPCMGWVGWESGVDDGRDGMGWWVGV